MVPPLMFSLGERDVKADVKAKNRRERPGAALLIEGETDADSYLAQVSPDWLLPGYMLSCDWSRASWR